MIGYSLLEDEQPRQAVLPPVGQKASVGNGSSLLKIRSECDMVVLGFVFATILLLLSDMFNKQN